MILLSNLSTTHWGGCSTLALTALVAHGNTPRFSLRGLAFRWVYESAPVVMDVEEQVKYSGIYPATLQWIGGNLRLKTSNPGI